MPTPKMPTSRALLLSILVLLLSPVLSPAGAWAQNTSLFEEPAVKEALQELESSLDAEFSELDTPGVVIVLVHDQNVVWTMEFGYASVVDKTAATSNTIFRIGSITKLFTATMLIQLRDEELLSLDQSAEAFMPVEINAPFADPRPISFRQLASHTSGFPPEGGDYWQSMSIPTIEKLYSENPIIHLESPPFTAVRYSNFGVSVMGDILARIANVPYEKYVIDRIWKPLGMTSTAFSVADLDGHMIATGYSTLGGTPKPVGPLNLNGLTPAGQAYSSAQDMAKFISLQFRPGAAGGSQILGGSSLREMHQPVFLFPGLDKPNPIGIAMGIGWFVREINGFPAIGHGGGIPGFTSDITLVPGFKIGIVNLTNGGAGPSSNPTSKNREILEKIIPIIATVKRDRRLKMAQFDVAWEKYIGEYDLAGVAVLSVVKQGKYMAFVHPLDKLGDAGILVPDDENLFVLEGGIASGATVRFEVDEEGKVTGLEIVGILSRKMDLPI